MFLQNKYSIVVRKPMEKSPRTRYVVRNEIKKICSILPHRNHGILFLFRFEHIGLTETVISVAPRYSCLRVHLDVIVSRKSITCRLVAKKKKNFLTKGVVYVLKHFINNIWIK